MLKPQLGLDKRVAHKDEVILRALEITEAEYGPFIFEEINVDMTPSRALTSMKTGEFINIFIAPSSEIWEENTIPIKVPIRQGLLSYRLLLVHKLDLPKFKAVNTLDDLKQLTAGLQNDWVTTGIFKKAGMKVITGHNFEGLFLMLNKHRFNYIPRAIYEIYDEYSSRKDKLNNVVIEPTLALYLPMATYVYVSPNEPRIAARVESGLRQLVASGEMTAILHKYYAQEISQADLDNRRIIEIHNPYFNDNNILQDKNLWYKNNN